MVDLRRDVTRTLEEAAYVAVGLAVLEVQKAQVRRRAVLERIGQVGDLLGDALGSVLGGQSPAGPGGDGPAAPTDGAPAATTGGAPGGAGDPPSGSADG